MPDTHGGRQRQPITIGATRMRNGPRKATRDGSFLMATDPRTGAAPVRGPAKLRNEWLDHLRIERGLSRNTLEAYRRDTDRWLTFLQEQGVASFDEVRAEDVRQFSAWLRAKTRPDGQPLAAASVARMVVAVRGLHRFLATEGHVASDVSATADVPQAGRSLPKALSVADVERLLSAPVGDGPLALRDQALLELLYSAGLRISEATAADVDDVVTSEQMIRVTGKGDRPRIAPYGEHADLRLGRWMAARPALQPRSPALFVNARGTRLSRQGAWKIIAGHARRVGLDDNVSPHTLRHCFATHLLDGGADIRAVQELLGHASVTTTQIYTSVSRSMMREAYTRSHPRATA